MVVLAGLSATLVALRLPPLRTAAVGVALLALAVRAFRDSAVTRVVPAALAAFGVVAVAAAVGAAVGGT